ncbi:uncharacterized protein LOC110824300 [Carica papaya]|uniref:uncharacterized protein LOC110824300 n=1 Tax=Carica papaya TaxID=3649 RepID=UPI000B8CF7B9|nr:uncharacterized protein LOC110824300 [Carica papaya]XP_021910578.1 uncharacterized protein LOC110824300 [Carica papaya]
MNQCGILQNTYATREEMRRSIVCPKPRRFGLLNATIEDLPIKPAKWHLGHQAELYESKPGTDFLDIILTEGASSIEQSSTQVASSPPFFCGSPPSRVSNPLTQDARFGDENPPLSVPSPPSSSARKAGCIRGNFGNKPVVRIEGFDCLDRDSRNCSIPALA